MARAQSSSSLTFLSSPVVPQSPPPESDLDHMSSMLAVSPPPVFSKSSSPPSFYGNAVPPIDAKAIAYQEPGHRIVVCIPPPSLHLAHDLFLQPFSLPRAFKDKQGQKQQPGLKDLPQWLRENFHNLYIRRIIEQVCLSRTPWSNPNLQSLQRELNYAYPTHRIRLHSDNAAVVPVSVNYCHHTDTSILTNTQTLRNLGVLQNQIGNEALTAVIAYLPSQYNKRALPSKDKRAKYITTVLADPQRPFIWEYFRPGTIPLPGERGYYDEAC